MSFSYKHLVGLVTAVAVLAIVFSATFTNKARATVVDCPPGSPVYGWAWSSTIGWISFNSKNPTGPGGPHCVALTASNDIVGWAWSSNVGWIKFGELTGFPTSGSLDGNAKIINNKIVGWARACAGTVRSGDTAANPKYVGDCSSMTSRVDGWDGWIELSDTKNSTPTHTLAYNPSTKTVTGYAWGSDVMGWITSFDLTIDTKTEAGSSCSLTSEPAVAADGKYTLTWNSNPPGKNIASCRGINFTADKIAGSTVVTPSTSGTVYTLMCTSSVGLGEITCDSPRSLTGPSGPGGGCTTPGGCGTGGDFCTLYPNDPLCESITPGSAKLKLMVYDSRFKTKVSTSDDTDVVIAKVQKGVPFTLTAFANESDFDGPVTLSVDKVGIKIKQSYSASGASQAVDQSVGGKTIPTAVYTLEGFSAALNMTIAAEITVQIVDPQLQEI